MMRLLPILTATKVQTATYLLGIALFSIAFLVFLNSSISFVVTDVIGQKDRVGDAVGTLGFADELLALVACPAWGLLSDRVGVRTVAVLGYCIVGISLICLVQSSSVYPELLIGRLGFSVGGAACSTMVTAVLPSMVAGRRDDKLLRRTHEAAQPQGRQSHHRQDRNGSISHGGTPSVSSEVTITPVSYSFGSRRGSASAVNEGQEPASTSQLAGLVGLFTGAGALVALGAFLPLPARFQGHGDSPAASVQKSFYIVGSIALCVAIGIFFGLRGLAGEEDKNWKALFHQQAGSSSAEARKVRPTYTTLIRESVKLGFTDSSIGLGYIGGFVARASSVGISLFIPLFVNAYFVRTGLCKSNPDNITDIKENCQRAYTLAAALTGIAETAALIGAPFFGWAGARFATARIQWPLLLASIFGILGYLVLGFVHNPDAFHGKGDSRWALVAVIAVGISQIGAIVCSLAVLGKGINTGMEPKLSEPGDHSVQSAVESAETAPLLPSYDAVLKDSRDLDRSQLKGTIAGVYSLLGGAGILLLTKAGGALFDSWTPGAPFFIMAIFNAMLLVAVVLVGLRRAMMTRRDTPAL